MQTEVCRSPVEIGTRQIITPLSGLRLTPVASLMSIPRRAERPSIPHRPIQPRPANLPKTQRIVIRATDTECSISSSTTREDWVRSRRELLRRKFEQRPSRERLVTQHILLSDGRVSPLIEQQARALRQNRIKNNLSRKLGQRPGPLELVTRKILQVDAELETAIQEGRLSFTPTKEKNIQEIEDFPPTPITTDMEVIATVKQPPKSLSSLTNKGILRKPNKPNPYKPFEQSAPRAKTKTQDSRLDTVEDGCLRQHPQEQNNYELILQQQRLFLQYQNSSGLSECLPSSETTVLDQGNASPLSTTGIQTIRGRKLSDLKVQELKNECKKRSLPVSGAKPQLLERLRGFEKDILGATPPPSPPIQKDDHVLGENEADKSQESHMLSHCNGIHRQCSPPEIIFQSEGPARASVQQKELVQPSMRTVSQLVSVQGNGQVVQLYDEWGHLLGMGTVQLQSDSTQSVVLQQRVIPQASQSEPVTVTMAPSTRVIHATGPPQLQKQQDGTFCFAQMGSGGQFTAANEIIRDNSQHQHKLQTVQAPIVVNQVIATPAAARVINPVNKSNNMATGQSQQKSLTSSPMVVSFQPKCQSMAQEIQRPQQLTNNRLSSPKLQSSPRVADHPECSPSMPLAEGNRTDSCTPIEVIKDDEKITLDPNDPASVLTPTTLQMHEEMLRSQHKKIEELERDITASQVTLRKHQQIILAAKKMQQKLREKARYENEEADNWIKNMDVRSMNKVHIQNFIQHKSHVQKLASISKEHNRLKTTEERLQEELHVDQAVHDIVRLIKQDPRTALLIVQLLRKYQLERTQAEITAIPEHEDDVIEMNSIDMKQDSVQSEIFSERKASFGSDISTSSAASTFMNGGQTRIITRQQPMQQTQNVYYSEPMEGDKHENVDMEAIFKSVLEDATRALANENQQTPEQNVECIVSAIMDSPKQTNHVEWNSMARQTASVPFPQITQQSRVEHADNQMNHNVTTQNDVDFPSIYRQNDNYPTLDEVMAVVRADSDFAGEPFGGVEYGSEELAQLLGDDWLNCAERSISLDGQYIPYDENGRSTDPMSMGMPINTAENMNMDWLDEVLHHEPVDTQLFGH